MRRTDGVGVPVSIQTGFDMWKDFAFGVTKNTIILSAGLIGSGICAKNPSFVPFSSRQMPYHKGLSFQCSLTCATNLVSSCHS